MTLPSLNPEPERRTTDTAIGPPRRVEGRFLHLLWILPATLLLAALMRLPYGYYTLLRLVVCGCAGLSAWLIYDRLHGRVSTALLAALALLYNPFVIVRLHRDEWAPINLVTAAIFAGVGLFALRRLAGPNGMRATR